MAAEQQGIMSLPQGGQEATPQLSIDDSYDAISGALGDASPEASGQLQQLMAQLTPMLDQLPDEQLDAMIQIFQYLHDHPEEYAEKVADLVQHGVIDEGMLPEKYDPELIAALGMVFLQAKKERQAGNSREMQAQMPMPPATMARGGIAEAARMVASQGRNGDTMLAHINPKEAKMLRKKGGTGTINPATGLPEYGWWTSFRDTVTSPVRSVASAVRSVTGAVADAVKPVLNTTVGRVLATAALATFIGPGAFGLTGALGVGASLGLASGIVTAAAGGSLKDVLRAGATSFLAGALSPVVGSTVGSAVGVTSAAGQAALGAGLTGAGIAKLSGQSLQDAVKSGLGAGLAAGAVSLANTPTAPVPTEGGAPVVDAKPLSVEDIQKQIAQGGGQQPTNPNAPPPAATTAPGMAAQGPQSPDALGDFITRNDQLRLMANTPAGEGPSPFARIGGGIGDLTQGNFQQGYEGIKQGLSEGYYKYLSPSGIQEQGMADATAKANAAYRQTLADTGSQTLADKAYQNAYDAAKPGVFAKYGPAVGAGLGIAALAGGFKPTPVPPSALAQKMAGDYTKDLIDANPSKYYIQNLSGVTYDPSGRIIGSSPYTPAGTMEDVRRPMPGTTSTFTPNYYAPQGAVGQMSQVPQPYNTSNMYSNLFQPINFYAPRRAAEGGYMQAADGGMMNPYDPPSEGGMGDMGITEPVQHKWLGGIMASLQQALAGVPNMVKSVASPALSALNDFRSSSPAPAATPAPAPAPARAAPSTMQAPTLGTPSAGISSLAARMYPSLYNQQFQQQLMRPRGLASLADGGYPRRTGQISGPGSETSDSIPAMLSDGEFVMTAKAVRGAGKGDRRAGAKKMYALMHQLERNASRG